MCRYDQSPKESIDEFKGNIRPQVTIVAFKYA